MGMMGTLEVGGMTLVAEISRASLLLSSLSLSVASEKAFCGGLVRWLGLGAMSECNGVTAG